MYLEILPTEINVKVQDINSMHFHVDVDENTLKSEMYLLYLHQQHSGT